MSTIDRRKFVAGSAALGLGLTGLPSISHAQRKSSPDEKTPSELIDAETQKKVDDGLKFLAKRQIQSGRLKGAFGMSGYPAGTAVAGLSGLAWMCSGSSPGQGPYGKNIDMAAEFLMTCSRDTGYIAAPTSHDNMYGHGFATLFLAEVYGMTMNKEVGKKLRQSVKLICECQNSQGGWRYQPVKSSADLSITICQIMALRAARDAGINVPDEVRKLCIEYVKNSQNSDGGFRYTLSGGGSTFPLTGAGLVALYSAGIYDGEIIDKGLKKLMTWKPGRGSASHYYYAHYYAVQAMWHAGGKYWDEWYPAIRDELKKKHSGGQFTGSSVCPEFGTAMACIILQMPNNFLPVFAP